MLPSEEIYKSGDEIWAFHRTLANIIIEEFSEQDNEPETLLEEADNVMYGNIIE